MKSTINGLWQSYSASAADVDSVIVASVERESTMLKLQPKKFVRTVLARNWAGILVSASVVFSVFFIAFYLSIGVTRVVFMISNNVGSLLV